MASHYENHDRDDGDGRLTCKFSIFDLEVLLYVPGYLQLSMDIVKCETDISVARFTATGKTAITYKKPARRLFLNEFKNFYAFPY